MANRTNRKVKNEILFWFCHTDTVHTPEQSSPVEIKDQKIYGPGAQDMQGSIYCVFEMLKQLNDINKLTNLVLILNSCEEKGSPEFREIMQEMGQELDYVLGYECSDSDGKDPLEFVITDSRKGTFQEVIELLGPGGHTGSAIRQEDRSSALIAAAKFALELEGYQILILKRL